MKCHYFNSNNNALYYILSHIAYSMLLGVEKAKDFPYQHSHISCKWEWDRGTQSLFFFKKNRRIQESNGKKQENGKFKKRHQWEVYVQDCGRRQVYYFFNVTFSLWSIQTSTAQEVVNLAVCMPRGYCIAFVSKNSYLWLLKGSVWKK